MGLLAIKFGRGLKAKEMLPVLQCAHGLCIFLLRTVKLPLKQVQEIFYDPTMHPRTFLASVQGNTEALSPYPYAEPIDPCDTSRKLLNVLEELLPIHAASSKICNLSRQLYSSLRLGPLPSALRPKQPTTKSKKPKMVDTTAEQHSPSGVNHRK